MVDLTANLEKEMKELAEQYFWESLPDIPDKDIDFRAKRLKETLCGF